MSQQTLSVELSWPQGQKYPKSGTQPKNGQGKKWDTLSTALLATIIGNSLRFLYF